MWPFKTKKKSSVETKSHVLGTSSELGSFLVFGQNGATTATSAMQLYSDSTAVSIPVNLVADAFASIEPVVKENGKIITGHPVLDLLNKPSPFFSQDLFFETIGKHYLITGNAYITALGGVNRPPIELQPISPANVSQVEGGQGFVENFIIAGNTLAGNYSVEKKRGQVRYLSGSLLEIKQIRAFSIRNNSLLRGESLLESASSEVRSHILGNEHNVNLLERGGRIYLVFNFVDNDMTQDDFAESKKKIDQAYGKKGNTHVVTSGGEMEVTELGTNNRDMDFANLQKMAKEATALQFKVPLALINQDASTFNNVAASQLMLYDNATLPLADRIFGGLTDFLMPRYGEDPAKTQITYNMDTITALAIRRNEELKLRTDAKLETHNELRATFLGREPIDGGDQVLVPANMVPLGTDIFTDDNITTTPSLARDA